MRVGFDDVVVAGLDPNLAFYNLSVAGDSSSTLADNAAVYNNLSADAGGMLALGTYNLTVEGTVANNGALAQTKTINTASTSFLNLKNSAGSVDKYWGATIDPGSNNLGSTTFTLGAISSAPRPAAA